MITAMRRPMTVLVVLTMLTTLTEVALAATPATAGPASAAGPVAVASAGVGASAAAPAPTDRYAPAPPRSITCTPRATARVTLRCVIGHSVRGRAIVAKRQGDASAPRVLVVSGQMHGNEWPGPLVVGRVRHLAVPAGLQVWTVRTLNPDGKVRARRHNAHGVDLNRNFPEAWSATAYAGRRALSEPESRAMARLLTWVQPDLVVSFHGFSESVDTTGGGRRAALARRFSRLAHIGPAEPVPCGGPCRGNMTAWYTAVSRVGGVAFTVEMPRTSRGTRRCRVPGATVRMPVIECAARASVALAGTLPQP